MALLNKSKGILLTRQLEICKKDRERIKGLMGKRRFSNKALLIERCNQIHTWFMRFPIDILFINETNHVIAKKERFHPWKVSEKVEHAIAVIEAEGGFFADTKVEVGDMIEIVRVESHE